MVVLCGQYVRPGFNPPSIPDYSDGVQQPGGAFLVPEEHVSFMAQGEFYNRRTAADATASGKILVVRLR
jgi:hypothetical protein